MASNTFPLPKVVSTLQQSRLDYNEALTSVLTNFASPVPPNSTNIQLVDSTGLQTGMMYYKSGSNVALGQGLLYIYNGSSFVRNGIATYRVGSTNIANAAIVAGYLKSGDLIISDAQPDRLFMVNASNTYVIDTGIPPGGYTVPNADMLDGLDSSQFVRRDVAQTIPAAMTFVAPVIINNTQSNVKTIASIWTGTSGAIGFNSLGRIHWDTSRIALCNGVYYRDGALRYMYTGNGFAGIDTETAGKDGVIRLRVGPKGTAESAAVIGTNIELSNTGIALNGDVSAGSVNATGITINNTNSKVVLNDTNGSLAIQSSVDFQASGNTVGFVGYNTSTSSLHVANDIGNVWVRGSELIGLQLGGVTRVSIQPNTTMVVNGNVAANSMWVTNTYVNNGTAVSPTYTFVVDSDTGIYRAGADIIGFTTGGVERVRISNTGTVLGDVTVTGLTIPDYIVHSGDTDSYIGFPVNDTFTITLGGSERVKVNAFQTFTYNQFSVYNNNAVIVLQDVESNVGSNVTAYILMRDSTSTNQGLLGFIGNNNLYLRNYNGPTIIQNEGAHPVLFRLNGIDRARFDANGSLSANSISAAYFDARDINGFRGVTDSASNPSFSWTNDLNTGMFWPSADTIGFTTGGIEKLRIRSDGRVGIGTSTPNRLLEVSGPAASIVRLNDTNGVLGGSVSAGIELTANGALSAQIGYFSSVNSSLLLANQSGNVIIRADQTNTQADSSIFLQIDGATKSFLNSGGDWFANSYCVQGVESVNNPSFSWSYERGLGMYRSASNTVAFASGGSTLFSISPTFTYVAKGNLSVASGYVRADSFYAIDSYYWNSPGVAIRNPTANTLSFLTSGTESVRIDSYGRVGIGTSAPSALLDVVSTAPTIRLNDTDATPDSSMSTVIQFSAGGNVVSRVGHISSTNSHFYIRNSYGPITIASAYENSDRGGIITLRANASGVFEVFPNNTSRASGVSSAAYFDPHGTNGFRHRADSAATPGFTWVGNVNTGMYNPAANEIGFSTGGVKIVGISSSGLEVSGVITGTAVTQTSVDKTSNRLVKTGDFGLGKAIQLTSSDNLDNITASGFYYNSTAANTPGNNYPLTSAGSLQVTYYSSTGIAQTFITYSGPTGNLSQLRMFVRSRGGSAWSPWAEVLKRDNILGTVSMSSGEPTGAIIERSSNANGEYVKFADGTLICNKVALIPLGIGPWAFPAAFISNNYFVSLTANATGVVGTVAATALNHAQVAAYSIGGGSWTGEGRLTAIGRWI